MTKLQTLKLLQQVMQSPINETWRVYVTKRKDSSAIYFIHRELDPCIMYLSLKEESSNTISWKINYERRALETPDDNTFDAWNLQAPFILNTAECPDAKEFSKDLLTLEKITSNLDKYVVEFNKDVAQTDKAQSVIESSWAVINQLKRNGVEVTNSSGTYTGKIINGSKTVDFSAILNKGEFSANFAVTGSDAVDFIKQVASL